MLTLSGRVYMFGYLGFDKVNNNKTASTATTTTATIPYHRSGELMCMQTHVKRSFSTTIQTMSTHTH